MSDTVFYVSIGALCLQILVMTMFYFTTYQRLFFKPGTGNVVPFVLFLLFFKIAYPVTFVTGWIRCRSLGLVRVMTFWTIAMTVMIGGFVMVANMPTGSELAQSIWFSIFAVAVSGLAVGGLWKAFQFDGRMRMLMREPTDQNLSRFAELGPSIIPHLERLLESSYAPTRLTAVKCLRRFGNDAQATFLLQVATSDEDPSVSEEAVDALVEIQPQAAPA